MNPVAVDPHRECCLNFTALSSDIYLQSKLEFTCAATSSDIENTAARLAFEPQYGTIITIKVHQSHRIMG